MKMKNENEASKHQIRVRPRRSIGSRNYVVKLGFLYIYRFFLVLGTGIGRFGGLALHIHRAAKWENPKAGPVLTFRSKQGRFVFLSQIRGIVASGRRVPRIDGRTSKVLQRTNTSVLSRLS